MLNLDEARLAAALLSVKVDGGMVELIDGRPD
jgi:hypothetical protein